MNPVRTLARPLLASMFVSGGVDMLRNPGPLAPVAEPVTSKVVEAAQPVADRAAEAAGAAVDVDLPDDPELLTQVAGGVMVGAGALLAIGKLPRLSAAALAATLVPTTLAAHRFWELDDPEERSAQQVHFMKNLGLLGGLALAALDTEGRPSAAWRARHASRTARREARLARRAVAAEAGRRADAVRATVADVLPG